MQLADPYVAYDVNGVYLPYVYHVLNNKLRKSAMGTERQSKRVTVQVIKDIKIELLVVDDKTLDKKSCPSSSTHPNWLLMRPSPQRIRPSSC
jgi:hypothetical protein